MVLIPSAGPSAAVSGNLISSIPSEGRIRTLTNNTIVITLTDDTWLAADGNSSALVEENATALLGLVQSAQSEAKGWNQIVGDATTGLAHSDVERTSDTVVTISLPAFNTFSLSAPETISVQVPGSVVASGGADLLATPTITVVNDGESNFLGHDHSVLAQPCDCGVIAYSLCQCGTASTYYSWDCHGHGHPARDCRGTPCAWGNLTADHVDR